MGHLSFHCPKKTARHTETNADEEQPNTENIQTETAEEQATTLTMEHDTIPERVQEMEQETTPADYNEYYDMDTSITAKHPHQIESDSRLGPATTSSKNKTNTECECCKISLEKER